MRAEHVSQGQSPEKRAGAQRQSAELDKCGFTKQKARSRECATGTYAEERIAPSTYRRGSAKKGAKRTSTACRSKRTVQRVYPITEEQF